MLVSKSNGFNASAVLGSGSYNENKSSKHMELLAHSILKLICKEAASETYRGALETLQKMMSDVYIMKATPLSLWELENN